MKLAPVLLCLWMMTSTPAPAANEPDALAQSTQLIVVTTPDWDAVEGRLQRYQRATPHAAWQPVGESLAVVVGKNGMGWGRGIVAADSDSGPVKKEGDGKAPAGIFELGTAFGYASQPLQGWKMSYLSLTPSIECVDDVRSKYYNRVVDRSTVTPDWNSSEHMRETGELYRWGVVVDHNGTAAVNGENPPVPGDGSCVFLHIWRSSSQGTAGCTAMPQVELEALIAWLDPKRRPLLVQLPAKEYGRWMNRWELPTIVNLPKP